MYVKRKTKESRQRGVAILAMALILMIVSTLMVLAVSKSGINEQRIVGNDLRGKDIYAAAMAGLDRGQAWLEDSNFILLNADTNNDGAIDANDNAIISQTIAGDKFDNTVVVRLIEHTPSGADPMVVEVISTATMAGDTQVTKTMSSKYVVSSLLGTGGVLNGPPLIVENCTTGITGNPEVTPTPNNYGMGTISGTADDTCLQEGNMELNGSTKVDLDGFTDAFAAVFGPNYTEEDLIADAAQSSHIIYVDNLPGGDWPVVGNQWQVDLGGPTGNGAYDTYILYFDSSADCPKLNAGVTVYGVVFYESGNCSTPGWGGGNVYGNVVMSGNLNQLAGNGDLFYLDRECGGTCSAIDTAHDRTAAQIPSSWRDY